MPFPVQDLKMMKESFAAAADEARLRSLFNEKICRNEGKGLDLLGEGTHFRAFRLRDASGGDLVIKRALPHFAGGPGSPGRRAWQRALDALRPLVATTPLLAPWLVIEEGDELGLATPYGPEPALVAAARWQPLAEARVALTASLKRAGLEIADQLQLRCRNGVPFVIDLSDLRRLAPGSL